MSDVLYDLWVTFEWLCADADGFGSGWCVGLDFVAFLWVIIKGLFITLITGTFIGIMAALRM